MVEHHLGPATDPPLFPCSGKPGQRAFRQANAFLLGGGGYDAQHRVFEDAAGIQVLLRERTPVDAVAGQPFQVVQGFAHTFPAEAIQGPEQHHVKLALGRVLE